MRDTRGRKRLPPANRSARAVHSYCDKYNWSLQEFADYCGVKLSALSYYIRGKRMPSMRAARLMYAAAKIPMDGWDRKA